MSKNYKSRRRGKGFPARELKTPKQSYDEKLERLCTLSGIDYKQSERLREQLDKLRHILMLQCGETRRQITFKKELERKQAKLEAKVEKLKRNLAIVTPKKEDKLAGTQIAKIMRKI